MMILWTTAFFPGLRLHAACLAGCSDGEKAWRLILLFSSFFIMAVGAGGIKSCCATFGADQVNNPSNPQNPSIISRYYSYYYGLVSGLVMVSVLALSKLHELVAGWPIVFAVPPVFMLLSFTAFISRPSRYVKVVPMKNSSSRNSGIWKVIKAIWRRRRLSLPPSDHTDQARWFHHDHQSTFICPTDRLRFLNRGCLLTGEEEATNTTTILSTVREVEELKAVISVIPIWSTGIIMTVVTSHGAFPNYQAQTMDRHLGHMNLAPSDYIVFNIGAMTLWMLFYAKVITASFNSKGIPPQIRMAIGILLSVITNVVAGSVEHIRRSLPLGTMSGNWLIPQLLLMGLAEAFYMTAQLDFFNSQFPEEMKNLGNLLLSLGQGVGMTAGAMLLSLLKKHTGWLKEDLNRGRIDYYYWLMAGVSFLNLCYYLFCWWWYGNGNGHTLWADDHVEEAQPLPDIVVVLEVEHVEDQATILVEGEHFDDGVKQEVDLAELSKSRTDLELDLVSLKVELPRLGANSNQSPIQTIQFGSLPPVAVNNYILPMIFQSTKDDQHGYVQTEVVEEERIVDQPQSVDELVHDEENDVEPWSVRMIRLGCRVDLATEAKRQKKNSQRLLKELYEAGHKQVGLLGEDGGRYPFYVLYQGPKETPSRLVGT
ncbi:Protein NRT1/ PTR FAMILY 1.1 [Linum grandiflorum]